MCSIDIEEWELLLFFGVETHKIDCSIPWFYNTSVYRHTEGDFLLSFSIQPSDREIEIFLEFRNFNLLNLEVSEMKSVKLLSEKVENI